MNALDKAAATMTAATNDALREARVGDLTLALAMRGPRRQLRFGCEGRLPAPEQVQAVLAAFHVPGDPALSAGRVKAQQPTTGRWYTLHYYEARWQELGDHGHGR